MKSELEKLIDTLNKVLGLHKNQVGYYVLNRDAGLFDIRRVNEYGGSRGWHELGKNVCGQFSIERDAVSFVNNLIKKAKGK